MTTEFKDKSTGTTVKSVCRQWKCLFAKLTCAINCNKIIKRKRPNKSYKS